MTDNNCIRTLPRPTLQLTGVAAILGNNLTILPDRLEAGIADLVTDSAWDERAGLILRVGWMIFRFR